MTDDVIELPLEGLRPMPILIEPPGLFIEIWSRVSRDTCTARSIAVFYTGKYPNRSYLARSAAPVRLNWDLCQVGGAHLAGCWVSEACTFRYIEMVPSWHLRR